MTTCLILSTLIVPNIRIIIKHKENSFEILPLFQTTDIRVFEKY